MNEDYKKLYEAVSASLDVGDYDYFMSKMNTPDDRKKFYDAVSNAGFDLGDYNEYESRLTVSQPEEQLTEEMMETGQRNAAPEYAMTEEKYAAEKKKDGESPSQDGVSADVVEEPVVEEEPVGIFPVEEEVVEEVSE